MLRTSKSKIITLSLLLFIGLSYFNQLFVVASEMTSIDESQRVSEEIQEFSTTQELQLQSEMTSDESSTEGSNGDPAEGDIDVSSSSDSEVVISEEAALNDEAASESEATSEEESEAELPMMEAWRFNEVVDDNTIYVSGNAPAGATVTLYDSRGLILARTQATASTFFELYMSQALIAGEEIIGEITLEGYQPVIVRRIVKKMGVQIEKVTGEGQGQFPDGGPHYQILNVFGDTSPNRYIEIRNSQNEVIASGYSDATGYYKVQIEAIVDKVSEYSIQVYDHNVVARISIFSLDEYLPVRSNYELTDEQRADLREAIRQQIASNASLKLSDTMDFLPLTITKVEPKGNSYEISGSIATSQIEALIAETYGFYIWGERFSYTSNLEYEVVITDVHQPEVEYGRFIVRGGSHFTYSLKDRLAEGTLMEASLYVKGTELDNYYLYPLINFYEFLGPSQQFYLSQGKFGLTVAPPRVNLYHGMEEDELTLIQRPLSADPYSILIYQGNVVDWQLQAQAKSQLLNENQHAISGEVVFLAQGQEIALSETAKIASSLEAQPAGSPGFVRLIWQAGDGPAVRVNPQDAQPNTTYRTSIHWNLVNGPQ